MIGWLINRLSGYQRDRVVARDIYASESRVQEAAQRIEGGQ